MVTSIPGVASSTLHNGLFGQCVINIKGPVNDNELP